MRKKREGERGRVHSDKGEGERARENYNKRGG